MSNDDQDINLKEILLTLYTHKKIIIYSVSLFVFLGIIFSLFLPDKYKADTLLIPVEDESNISPINQLGGLASLSGITLPKPAIVKSELALEMMTSKIFLYKFLNQNNILVDLMATKGWSSNDNKLIINEKLYDQKTDKWLRKVSEPFKPKPSNFEAYEYWIDNVYSIEKSDKTRFIKISLSHYSPYIVQKWSNLLINQINNDLKAAAILESEKKLEYLKKEVSITSDNTIKSMLYDLIETEMQKLALANTSEEFALKVIDPAIVPSLKSSPNRILLIFLSGVLGLFLSSFYVFVRHYLFY
ncbi:Wzz/FepE/Etk N-terminal domain-containing protein [Gammaproteobacteria bacterium]|nr:Wzz/FepE/Etk N-terminal domain-containing protein [Gammaproteobacteria bacterium]